MNVTLTYCLSDAGRKAAALAGLNAAEEQRITIDIPVDHALIEQVKVSQAGLPELQWRYQSPQAEAPITSLADLEAYAALLKAKVDAAAAKKRADAAERLEWIVSQIVKSHADGRGYSFPVHYDRPERLLNESEADDATRAMVLRLQAENDRLLIAEDEAKAAADAQAKAAAAADRERRDAEKSAWIAEHGSDYLRKAAGAGYDCQRLYVTERAAVELPGFTLDFDDNARWRDRSCPSEEALDEAITLKERGFDAEVAWMTRDADDDEVAYEAVVVNGFLGKYDAIKRVMAARPVAA